MVRKRSIAVAALASLWLALAGCAALPSLETAIPNDGVAPAAASSSLALLPPRSAPAARRGATLDPCVLPPRLVVPRPVAFTAGHDDTTRALPPALAGQPARARAPPLG